MPQTLRENRLISVKQNSQHLHVCFWAKRRQRHAWSLLGCSTGRPPPGLGPPSWCCPGQGASPTQVAVPAAAAFSCLLASLFLFLPLQESKPEQCLVGKGHSTGEQASPLGMAPRYSMGSRVWIPGRCGSQGGVWGHQRSRAGVPGQPESQPWLCLNSVTWSSLCCLVYTVETGGGGGVLGLESLAKGMSIVRHAWVACRPCHGAWP